MLLPVVVCGSSTSSCHMVKQLPLREMAQFNSIAVESRSVYDEIISRSGRDGVPRIFIDECHIGGDDDLAALDSLGELDPFLDTRRRLLRVQTTSF